MSKKPTTLFTLVVLVVSLACLGRLGAALRCYTCDSSVNGQSDCRDPFSKNGAYAVQCPPEAQSYCLKSSLGQGRFVRSCSNSCTTGVNCCSSDLCNPAAKFRANKLTAGLFLAAAVGLFKLLL